MAGKPTLHRGFRKMTTMTSKGTSSVSKKKRKHFLWPEWNLHPIPGVMNPTSTRFRHSDTFFPYYKCNLMNFWRLQGTLYKQSKHIHIPRWETSKKVLTKSPVGTRRHKEGRAIVVAHLIQHTRLAPTHWHCSRKSDFVERGGCA